MARLASHQTIDHLYDDLSLQEAILASLDGSSDDAKDDRNAIIKKIGSLKKQIAKMQPPLPNWGSLDNDIAQDEYNNAFDTMAPSSTSSDSNSQETFSPIMTIRSRKRPRNDFDDELDHFNDFTGKPIRGPPAAASPAPSVDSFGTDISDDPWFRKMFGPSYNEQKQSQEQALKQLDEKKKQEEADAAFAKQLAEAWNEESGNNSFSSQNTMPAGNFSQSFLNSTGLSSRNPINSNHSMAKPELIKPEPASKRVLESAFHPNDFDSDSDVEEIAPSDWNSRYGVKQPRIMPPTMVPKVGPYNKPSMPGAFPGSGFGTSYFSTPGTSVYNTPPYGTSLYKSSTSSLANPYNFHGTSSSMGFDAYSSHYSPFDPMYPLRGGAGYADPEQTQEEIKDLMKHIRPDEELTPEQLAEMQPSGLSVTLMPHQRKGYAWMKSMEEGTNKGGILADDMGLGKTIQALALILGRPLPYDEHGRKPHKPTLIVAPVALMRQWEREIKKMIHNSHRLNVLILHGSNRNSSWSDIKMYDVVLTTYGLLASDLKRKEDWEKKAARLLDAKPTPQQQHPVLSEKSKFYRVILDEAQNIKNKSTKQAAAACRIQAEYRWCLSGTPMQNNVDEIFSLIKFCRIRPYSDYEKFARDIGRPLRARGFDFSRDKAMQQLQALLRAVLLRRTKKSEIDGKPIIQLPEKHTIEDRTVFSQDEKDFYKALETQAQIQFNRYLEQGTIGRNYSHALVLLLRLRQCCCSPQLVTNAKDFLTNAGLQDLDYKENARLLPKDVVDRLKNFDAFECPICMDGVENPIIFNPCGHSLCQECLSTMVDKAMTDVEKQNITCPHCRAAIDPNKVTDRESFLIVHYPDHADVKDLIDKDENRGAGDNDDDDDDDTLSAGSDSDSEDDIDDESDDGEDMKDFIVPDDEEVEYERGDGATNKKNATGISKTIPGIGIEKPRIPQKVKKTTKEHDAADSDQNKKSKGKGKGKVKEKSKRRGRGRPRSKPDMKTLAQLRAEGLRSRAAKKKYINRLGRGYKSSSKIEKTIQLLKDIKANGQNEKTIIFSSFTSFLDLLEVALNRDGDEDLANYTRYDGSMSANNRNEAVVRFTDDPHVRSMLVSLKAGNSGLNLTAANHVIILDPFWNPFVEYQAADRCYRIGQLKEVTIHRVLVGEGDEYGNLISQPAGSEREYTVEDRILALQEKKRELVETALDEAASGNIGRLGVRELGFLFGLNAMDGS